MRKYSTVVTWALPGLALLLVSRSTAEAQPRSDSGTVVDDFPLLMEIDLFQNETNRITGRFVFYLPAGPGRYLPVSEAIASRLSIGPTVFAPGTGLRIVSSRARVTPAAAYRMDGPNTYRVAAGRVSWAVDLAGAAGDSASSSVLSIDFDQIAMEQATLAKRAPTPSGIAPRILIKAHIWPSRQEKQRLAKESEMAAARERAAHRARWLRGGAGAAGALLFLLLVLRLLRHRLWPDAQVEISPGMNLQRRAAVPSREVDAGVPFGTLVETTWARTKWRRPTRIKVEFLAGVSDTLSSHTRSSPIFRHSTWGEYSAEVPPRWPGKGAKLDLLVTTGKSVRPGRYLAKGTHGSVLITLL